MRAFLLLSLFLCLSTAYADDNLRTLAERGDAAALTQALADGGDVDERGPDGTTALHWAARSDRLATVRATV